MNWGILGLGRIAHKFADDLKLLPGARLYAVASTSLERARAFASEHGAVHAYGSYEGLLSCPGLDVVYVATPHPFHCEHALLCLENGLPVLCEKPMAMSRAEVFRMVGAARRNRLFLMEALWTRFIPAVRHALELLETGQIGKLHTLRADLGFKMPFDPQSRVYNKALGAGSLLDLGVYPCFLAHLCIGKPDPEHISAAANFSPTDVDETCVFTFQYPNDQIFVGHSTIAANTPSEAHLYGAEGTVVLSHRWHHTQQLVLTRYKGRDEHTQVLHFPYEGHGYVFEAAHVQYCLENSLLESGLLPLDFSLRLAETLDMVREKIGLAY